MIKLTPHQIPEVKDGETAARFLRWCARMVGVGFHPDNKFRDYVEADGVTITFHPITAIRLENAMDEACRHLIDQYAPGLLVQQGLLRVDEPVPGKCYVITGSGGLFEPDGLWPRVYPTSGAAEREVQTIVGELGEDDSDRARLMAFVDVVECSIDREEGHRDGEGTGLRLAGG